MRVYRATYRDRGGQVKQSAKWYIDIFDHNRLRHKIPAFEDKRLSEALGRNIESVINCRVSGLEPDAKLNQWIETLPDSLLRKLVSWGIMDGQRAEITKPLTEHIKDYVKTLEANGFSKDYSVRTKNRLNNIVTDCRFYYFRDITQSAVEIYIGTLKKKFNNTTAGHYLDAIKTFLNWAVQDQRIINNSLARVKKLARNSAKKGILTPEQFIHLIKTTFEKNIIIGNTTGHERAVLYLLAGTTGLRRNELLCLVWGDINLADNPSVRVRACIAKNGKEALQPIPLMVINLLTALKAHTKPNDNDRVFVTFGTWINTAGLIRDDLAVAKIELKDRDGNEICFHSLRNSYISFLANSATPAKVIQKLAQHSDPRLTFNTYARVFEDAEQKAINVLPNFGNFVLDTCLDKTCTKHGILRDTLRKQNSENTIETAFPLQYKIAPRGFEPLLPG